MELHAPAKPWPKKFRPVLVAVTVLWVLGIGAGLSALWGYENAPGVSAQAPVYWPTESPIRLDPDHPTLIMLVHPHCPCSRASIGELAELMAHSQGRLTAYVLFLKPAGFGDDWEKSYLWQSAARVPGVTVRSDPNGDEASRFHALTSGQTLLYGRDGNLLFKGGITGSRGHSGDNAGRSAILMLINGETTAQTETFVFGCPLFDPNSDCRKPDHETRKPQ